MLGAALIGPRVYLSSQRHFKTCWEGTSCAANLGEVAMQARIACCHEWARWYGRTAGLLQMRCSEIDKRSGIRGRWARLRAVFRWPIVVLSWNNSEDRRCEVKIEQVSQIDRDTGRALKQMIVVQSAF